MTGYYQLLMALKMAVGDIVNSKNLFSVILQKTALSAQEREKLIDNDYGRLIEAAKHLRLVDKEQNGKGSEIAEIILYGIMKNHYKALSAIPKIFL